MEPIITLVNVNKIYRVGEVDIPALKNVSVTINKGTFASFVGPSGSGKSTLSAPLAERLGTIRIRSDSERQRLLGKGKRQGETTKIDVGVYSPDATAHTYTILEELARETLEIGYPAVDATFLTRSQTEPFRALADHVGMPLRILYFCADPAALRQRIESRQREARDISEADVSVLEHQLATYAGLDDDE